jgi:hypothetical protein
MQHCIHQHTIMHTQCTNMYDDAEVRNVTTYQIHISQDSKYLESIKVYSLRLKYDCVLTPM